MTANRRLNMKEHLRGLDRFTIVDLAAGANPSFVILD
jgi:hypothetical protein